LSPNAYNRSQYKTVWKVFGDSLPAPTAYRIATQKQPTVAPGFCRHHGKMLFKKKDFSKNREVVLYLQEALLKIKGKRKIKHTDLSL